MLIFNCYFFPWYQTSNSSCLKHTMTSSSKLLLSPDSLRSGWLCSSASSFVCSQSSFLKSSSECTDNSFWRRSISANNVANVRPVSSAFLVPFCWKERIWLRLSVIDERQTAKLPCLVPPSQLTVVWKNPYAVTVFQCPTGRNTSKTPKSHNLSQGWQFILTHSWPLSETATDSICIL